MTDSMHVRMYVHTTKDRVVSRACPPSGCPHIGAVRHIAASAAHLHHAGVHVLLLLEAAHIAARGRAGLLAQAQPLLQLRGLQLGAVLCGRQLQIQLLQ